MSAGFAHTCGFTTGNDAYCWGDARYGQLGAGFGVFGTTPTPVAGGLTFAQVSAGPGDHTCGVTSGNDAYCWGRNHSGQLGDGTTDDRFTPTRVAR